MLKFYQGCKLETLAREMAGLIKDNQPVSVFDRQLVSVHSQGMARWLMQELAIHLGVSANIDFCFPGKLLNDYIYTPMMKSQNPEQILPVFSIDSMTWEIVRQLETLKDDDQFTLIRDYIGQEPGAAVKTYQIAARIARLFDKYMTYRPDRLRQWENQPALAASGDEIWQRILWNQLIKNSSGTSASTLFWQFLKEDDSGNSGTFLDSLVKLGTVYFFGISSLPPVHLELIQRVSRNVDIHFFWFNPSRECWDGAKSKKRQFRTFLELSRELGSEDSASSYLVEGNPLLGSWGRVGQEFFRLLLESCAGDVGMEVPEERVEPTTVLGVIQEDIKSNTNPDEKITIDRDKDDSLVIHNCFSPMREIESLYDNLLTEFLADETLLPRDITVYVPDMELYAPYIQSVFGSISRDSARYIPYTIADRTLVREYPECVGFQMILKVLKGRFKASDILGLLDIGAIRESIGLSEDLVPTLQLLLHESRVAWGIDGQFREKTAIAAFHQNSWRFAMDRMIFGAAMGEDGIRSFEPQNNDTSSGTPDGIVPLESAEARAHLIGHFCEFMESLFALANDISEKPDRPASEWIELATDMIDTWFSFRGQYGEGTLALKRTVRTLQKDLENARMLDHDMSFDLFEVWINEHLETRRSDEKFCRGMVTFCRFQPMRTIPSRITCIIGMSDNAFPRQDKQLSFDLISGTGHYYSDGSAKQDDRYSFLECLLSAREKLYISYVGQSDKGKDQLPPAALISELCDTINGRFQWTRPDSTPFTDRLTIKHPLHPFGADYFRKSSRGLTSHSRSWYNFAEQLSGQDNDQSTITEMAVDISEPLTEISLNGLISFFKSPCKYYYKQILGIDLELNDEKSPQDNEPETLNKLEEWSIRQQIFDELSRQDNEGCLDKTGLEADFRSRFRNEGILPVGSEGEIQFEKVWNDAELFYQQYAEIKLKAGKDINPVSCNIDLDGCRLSIELKDLYRNTQIITRGAKAKWKDRLVAMIRHAALSLPEIQCISDMPKRTTMVNLDSQVDLPPMDPDDARQYLSDLIDLMQEGIKRPLCFWGPAADAAEARPEKYDKEATAKWEPGGFQTNYEQADEYTIKPFGIPFPSEHSVEFRNISEKTMRPYYILLQTEGDNE